MSINTITQEILSIYQKHAHISYGERCTVLSHSIQAGCLARDKGLDDELILAAFLHDIGHISPLENEKNNFSNMGVYGIEAHEYLGEKYLREKGLTDRIMATVRNHVTSKRYLCYADSSYYDQLSEASKKTLQYQGGPMTVEEAKAFEADPFFEDSIQIRKLDDEAKAQDFEVRADHWTYFEHLLNQIVE